LRRYIKIMHLAIYNCCHLVAPLIYRKYPEGNIVNGAVIFFDLLSLTGKGMQVISAPCLAAQQDA